MFRVINEYISKVNLQVNDDIYRRLNDYLKDIPGIKKSTVTVNSMRYVVDVHLNSFSVDNATRLFNNFNQCISYPYSSMFVRFNEGKCVRYRYITSREDKSAFYCDIVIS